MNDQTRLRVLRLGHSYRLRVVDTDWNRSFLGSVQGWCVSLDFGPGREASAVLKRDDGREYVEYAWGTEAFPPNFTYDDFELVVERTARATGHTRRILELVQ